MRHILFVLAIWGVFQMNVWAAVKEVVYDGQEIHVYVKRNHKTTVTFPEDVTRVVRGFNAEKENYTIERRETDPKTIDIMPLGNEIAEFTITGAQTGIEYSFLMVRSDDFYSVLTILPLNKAIASIDRVIGELKDRPSYTVVKREERNIVNAGQNIPSIVPTSLVTDKTIQGNPTPLKLAQDANLPGALSTPTTTLPEKLNIKITLKGNGLPLKMYLGAIGKATGYNIISTPEVDARKASINLENIEVWRALKSLLYPFSYGFKVSKEDLIISTLETRTFAIAVPAVEQSFSDVTSNESFTNQTNNSNNGSTSDQDVKVGTKILLENKSPSLSLWADLENNLKTMITPVTGQFSLNRVAGMLVVTDLPGKLDQIQDFIDNVNASLKRQASFEIQIIEVALTNEKQLGIDWDALVSNIGGLENITASTNFATAGFSGGQLLTLGASTSNSSTNNVSAVLKALETMGRVEIVSRPSITVSNMIPAVIQEGTSIGYISGIGDTFNNNVTTSNVTTSQVHGGLTMRLVAKIGDKGEDTILNLSTAVTNIDSITSVKSGNGVVQTPQVSNKSITTNVSVSEGKTLIIGGLISTNNNDTHTGVPGLSRMPVIGNAFKYTTKKNNKIELVIVITPKTTDKN